MSRDLSSINSSLLSAILLLFVLTGGAATPTAVHAQNLSPANQTGNYYQTEAKTKKLSRRDWSIVIPCYHKFKLNQYLPQHPRPCKINYSPTDYYLSGKNETTQKTPVNWTTFTLTSGLLAGFYTGLYKYGEQSRWNAPHLPFYFKTDFDPQGIDKFGHFYATKTQAFVVSNLYKLSGLKDNSANLLGAGIALSIQSLIEIKDGTISGGGFDTFDQISNTLGAGWFYTRERVEFLQRFNIRWFYYPSDNLSDNQQITEDYNGHTYWLSMRMRDLLPKGIQRYWPRFIVPAAGISLNNWSTDPTQNGELSYHLSLTLDFKHILPQQTTFGRTISEFLNGFYIPAPAFEVYPQPSVKLIFFGQK